MEWAKKYKKNKNIDPSSKLVIATFKVAMNWLKTCLNQLIKKIILETYQALANDCFINYIKK